jgi:hypothetical protein
MARQPLGASLEMTRLILDVGLQTLLLSPVARLDRCNLLRNAHCAQAI